MGWLPGFSGIAGMVLTSLSGKNVAIGEVRQQDILEELLLARGAHVTKVPLVAILDAPDPAPVLGWIQRFIQEPPRMLILLTGEGLRRLFSLARTNHLAEPFIVALTRTSLLCRGPKPARAARELGLSDTIAAREPTTDGVIATLAGINLQNCRVGVQLYGEEPNLKLISALGKAGAIIDTVAPYVYADREDENRVVDFIHILQSGVIDAVAFTSQPQFKRLQTVATARGIGQELRQGLEKTVIAAVGPVVRDQLEAAGYTVAVMPERTWFMKPLVTALGRYFENTVEHPL